MPKTRINHRDADSPFITAEGMKAARPFRERHPAFESGKVTAVSSDAEPPKRQGRGPGKTPAKKLLTLRLSPDVVDDLRATGPGWNLTADSLLRSGLKRLKRKVPSKAA